MCVGVFACVCGVDVCVCVRLCVCLGMHLNCVQLLNRSACVCVGTLSKRVC